MKVRLFAKKKKKRQRRRQKTFCHFSLKKKKKITINPSFNIYHSQIYFSFFLREIPKFQFCDALKDTFKRDFL